MLVSYRLASLIVAVSLTANAKTVVLTFQGLQDEEGVLNYFNGGTGSNGSGPGPNYGISFGSNSLAIINKASGGSGNVFGESSGNDASLFFLNGTGDLMNVAAGFTTGFSFYYSSPFDAGAVDVYSGLNGTGTLLASIALPTTTDGATVPGCDGYNYCDFVPIGVTFSGTAESVNFSGTANHIDFDEITLGSSTAGGTTTPEPAPLALFAIGSASVLAMFRRRYDRKGL